MVESNPDEGFVHAVEAGSAVRVVGVGASHGSAQALAELLREQPRGAAPAFVVVRLPAAERDQLTAVLRQSPTAPQPREFADGEQPAPGTVYLASPDEAVTFRRGALRRAPASPTLGLESPVNALFLSLADELGDQAIGVVLAGDDGDGAVGVRAIKEAGGVVIAQDPTTATAGATHRAAVLTGCVDLVVPASELGRALAQVSSPPNVFHDAARSDEAAELEQINELVRLHTSFRLGDYKSATVLRRIARRLNVLGLTEAAEYVQRLRGDKEEAFALMREVFIPVTSFFRDQGPFEELAKGIHELVRGAADGRVLRAWVAACASGEEAYTIAFLFEEALRRLNRPAVQYLIFASDMHEAALERARQGSYSPEKLAAVPPELRARVFEPHGAQFRVTKAIRNRLVFARQNLTDDPPFARVDLVSCRNLLIYFRQEVQRRVLELFHLALNPGGLLLLGRSEVIAGNSPLFSPLSTPHRLYQRRDQRVRYTLPVRLGAVPQLFESRAPERPASSGPQWIAARATELLLERHAPPAVVIDAEDRVIHFQGSLDELLQFPRGQADMSLYGMVDERLRAELRALVFRARRSTEPVTGGAWTLPIDGRPHALRLTLSPLAENAGGLLLVSFEATPVDATRATPPPADPSDGLVIAELERELSAARAHLNLVVEEFETSNEELQSVNEELQATKEELQSTNEELHTANQGLQASNEELLTVNEELRGKSAELEASFEDLRNMKDSLAFPLFVVDAELRVTHANAACTTLVHGVDGVVGRSLAALPWSLDVAGLIDQVRELISSGRTFERDLRGAAKTHLLRAMPFISRSGARVGAVLVFEEVTRERQAEADLRDEQRRLRQVLDGTNAGTFEANLITRQVQLNATYARLMGYELAELGPVTIDSLQAMAEPADVEKGMAALAAHFRGETPFYESERHFRHRDGSWRWFLDRGKVVSRTPDGRPELLLGTRLDITHRKASERELAEKQAQLQAFVRHAPVAMAMLDKDLRFLEVSDRWRGNLRLGAKAFAGVHLYDAIESARGYRESHLRALAGEPVRFPEERIVHPDGSVHWSQAELVPWREADGTVGGILITTEDITDRVTSRAQLERNAEELERRVAERVADLERTQTQLVASVQKLDQALLENDEHLRLLRGMVDGLPYGVVLFDRDDRALAWNQEFVRVISAPDSLVQKPGWTALDYFAFMAQRMNLTDAPAEAQLQRVRAATAKGERRTLRRLDDGRWLEARVVGLPSGKLVATLLDLTAQKQVEERLAEARRRLELAASAGVVGLFFVDVEPDDYELDEVGRRLLGIAPDAKLRWSDFAKSPAWSVRWEEMTRQAALTGSVDFAFDVPVGTGRTTAVRGRLVAGPDGRPSEMSGVLVDVTDRSRVEEMLREKADVESRGHEQARLRSIQLQKRELVGNLTGGIAHDFNNLLTVLGFATQSLEETVDLSVPDNQRSIADLQLAIERATLMTRRLLGFSRAPADEMAPVDADAAFRAIGALVPRLTGGRITVKVSSEQGAWILGSSAGIEQVVLNLAVNARDAMPDGGTLHCSLRREGTDVVIAVSDTGVGMSEDVQRRIFEPFFTTKQSGTGLGLATVQDVVQRFGGTIHCQSAVGKGTTFTVSFPRIEAPSATKTSAGQVRGKRLSGRALLVDDDVHVRRATQQVLELHGLEVTAISSGREAIALVKARDDFDVVVTDLSMPEMDGLQLGEELAALRPSLPVVFISGNQQPDTGVLARSNRAFLQKPMHPSALLDAIDGVRRSRRS